MSAQSNPLTLCIIIPVYNEQRYLARCLESIKNQSVSADEVIVVDNNSTDNSLSIAKKYPFVRIAKEPKQGVLYARNRGFNTAKSDIIGRIDGDSVLPQNWVQKTKEFFAEPRNAKSSLSGGGYFYNIRLPKLNGWVQSQMAYRWNKIILGHYILWGSNMAITRTSWLEVRGSVCARDDIHEDMDLAIHLNRLGYKIVYKPKLRCGMALKRVYSDRRTLHRHMSLWPKTFRAHGYRMWWMGSLGNLMLWTIGLPVFAFFEYFSRFLGKKPLED
jgi:glycosyltransferase involved in cell wall biosynthesis